MQAFDFPETMQREIENDVIVLRNRCSRKIAPQRGS